MRRAARLVLVMAVLTAGLVGLAHLLAAEPWRDETGLVPVTSAPHAPAAVPVRAGAGAATRGVVPSLDPAWTRRAAARSGIPETAVAAYARAGLQAPRRCGLGWTTLAAIGWVESQHGTLGGRILGLDGTSSSPVVGPALDGQGGFRAIAATPAGTALHGDPRWDHAVGPMQFITSTWQRWAADGDGDGRADPQDLDDAALAAARYLCAGGRDLTTGAGWSGGIFSYNRSQHYLETIHATATTYAERVAGRAG